MTHSRWRLVAVTLAATVAGASALPSVALADKVGDAEWWLRPLRIAEAQSITRGNGVVVGLIDLAVDDSRPELRGKVLSGKGVGSGFPSDGRGVTNDAHGTEMAGLIAGESPSKSGFLGVAPGAKILPFAGEPNSRTVAEGLRWLTDQGADVINISQGGPQRTAEEAAAVQYALSHDVVVVASAGNRVGSDNVETPANLPGVVAVSGVEKNGDFSNQSSFGPEVVLAAPGAEIPAPASLKAHDTGYGLATGTSPAAAIVSGVAALIRAKYPKLNAANVIERLIRTARDNGDPGRDALFGFGTVRPYQALTANVPEVQASSLGAPVDPSASVAAPREDLSARPVADSGFPVAIVLVVGVVGIVVALVILLIVLASRKRRRRFPVQGFGPPHPAGSPPGGWPQQYGPGGPPQQFGPPQYVPTQQYGPTQPQYGPPQQYGQQPPQQDGQPGEQRPPF